MVTIKDVAREAQVSVATVSRVLNNQGYVHEDTRVKVEGAIKHLQYRPNNVARSLFKKRSKMIGFIVPDITNPYFPQLVRAVEDVTNKAQYTTFLCNSDENLKKELMYLESMQENHIDGAIIVSNTLQLQHVDNVNIPIVALDRFFHDRIPSVTIDNYNEARKAVRYMLDRGCKRIAHIKGPEYIENSKLRQMAYEDEMRENMLPSIICNGEYHLKKSEKALIDLLMLYPTIDGVFAGNDVMAVGALKAASRLELKVPDDLSIVGFDGIEWTETVSPEITTMEQPIYEMGKRAATMLLELIDGKGINDDHVVYDTKLIERETTKKQ
ncbi:LacI family DNA-binding transcriptional regulator [Pseudalkalibacillus decolorationis]|uniref:LacI family DNA-binding transcriptional regulator n=1 Tax=Pseudalkalibacillus decolorationis TaxID=163879 RepID=UPI0021485CEE|nr:LacI family DNA-binding transcriptional regulator [Pseudalkalibacillus decolorationis]